VTGYAVDFTFGGVQGLSIDVAQMGSVTMWRFVSYLLYISVFWGLINLLPIYPLDGGQIARELLMKANPRQGIRQSLLLSVVAAGGLAVVGLVLWRSWFVALLFGYLAYSSYVALQAYQRRS
jgi:Zn-dependent protease